MFRHLPAASGKETLTSDFDSTYEGHNSNGMAPKPRPRFGFLPAFLVLLGVTTWTFYRYEVQGDSLTRANPPGPLCGLPALGWSQKPEALCPQTGALTPQAKIWEELGGVGGELDEEKFKERAVEWLGGAVRIPWVISLPSLFYSRSPGAWFLDLY
jgi:hypothetical protein